MNLQLARYLLVCAFLVQTACGSNDSADDSKGQTTNFQLTISIVGNGVVTSLPAGINCPSDCVEDFAENTLISLSAMPNPGNVFAGWSGDEVCGNGNLTITANTNCIAVFNQTILEPVLKWQNGGCSGGFCQASWYSSPAVADIDGDGTQEILGGGYNLKVLNGEDGSLQWQYGTASRRIWPGIIVQDIDNNSSLEIVFAGDDTTGNASVIALSNTGVLLWNNSVALPPNNEIRSLSVSDLDNDNTSEIIVGMSTASAESMTVLEHTGDIRIGWPQLSSTATGYGWGIYNANIAVGDINQSGLIAIVAPTDTPFVSALDAYGFELKAGNYFGVDSASGNNFVWGQIPVYENSLDELARFGNCSNQRTYRSNFGSGPAVIADLNGDGVVEIVSIGRTYEYCDQIGEIDKYNGVYIFNHDRTRFSSNTYDWSSPPLDITAAPLAADSNVIETSMPNPAVADLDNDGEKEIVFSSFDGKVHALWLDKTEHGKWPYDITQATDGFIRYSSEPVIVDLDNDGRAEVIVTSWTEKGSNARGRLHVIDYNGNRLFEVDLPNTLSASDWDGAMAAPTVANVDADNDFEIVISSAHSGLMVYDLPGTANARVLWGTGRGNYSRTGFVKPIPPVVNIPDTVQVGEIVVNEIMPNPGLTADINCDGTVSQLSDEFIEIVNTTSKTLDLNGVSVKVSGNIRYTFIAGDALLPGKAAVLLGGSWNCAQEINQFELVNLSLGNGGETIELINPSGTLITTATYVDSVSGISINLDPDVTGGSYANHDTIAGSAANFSPGFKVDLTVF